MTRGTILDYKPDRGFGFIRPEGGGPEVFFHASVVEDRGYQIEPGAPVEFQAQPGDKGPRATKVRLLGFAPEDAPQAAHNNPGRHGPAGKQPPKNPAACVKLPPECIFQDFYTPDGNFDPRLFFEAPAKAADLFRRAGLKSSQFRQLYNVLATCTSPLTQGSADFATVKDRFGDWYVQRVVRQLKRGHLPPIVGQLIDTHRQLALSEPKQMIGLVRYLKYIYCYFDKPENQRR